MSLYQLDKAIKLMTHNEDPAPFQEFLRDPGHFAGRFDLTENERTALLNKDATALYSMGVQPFILMMFAAKTSGEDPMAFMPKYMEMLKPLGHPSYET